MEKALVVVATRAESTATLHLLSRVSSTLRRVVLRAETDDTLARCMRAGKHAVTAVIRAYVHERFPGLTERCVDEAVGAVVVYRLRHEHIASWGAHAHFWHASTLIVASAVNVDEWRVALIARGREADRGAVYTNVIRHVEARALRLKCA
jgi:hypothetical protein